ncbi:hypothetical protein KSX_94100 [Ktedonospora formicarum]|uniref:Uncharacterized protein n=1 Tax=Ktedonospora formicarum TaxID=2778364 RepID=A0A8J3IEF8_9CHLR|nr:hypothetical protein KSX_94100 [Ktedonospora formicarum]
MSQFTSLPHLSKAPSKQHPSIWEYKTKKLLITVDALRANPAYERARQKHEQELQHTEKGHQDD